MIVRHKQNGLEYIAWEVEGGYYFKSRDWRVTGQHGVFTHG